MKWRYALALIPLALGACSTTTAPDPTKVIAGALASSVQLFAERGNGSRRAGSGVVVAIAPDGKAIILTAAHLIEPLIAQEVYVKATRRGDQLTARILASDPQIDVAVLEVEGLDARPADFQSGTRLGDSIWVISFPWGRNGTLVTGVVSQVAGDEDGPLLPLDGPVKLIDAAVSYGTSGGGVFDSRSGRLVGIVRGYRTAKLALPVDGAKPLEFPIAGETTVVPSEQIFCALSRADLAASYTVLLESALAQSTRCAVR